MNKAFRLSVLGVLVCAGVTILSAQEPVGQPSPASPPLLTLGLLVDNSGSLRTQFGAVIAVSRVIVESTQTGDEIFIVRFVSSEEISIVQDFTTQKSALTRALDEMYIQGGLSAITDAVYLAADRIAKKGDSEDQKRALILITDGADENSFYKPEPLLSRLREKKLRVYAIGFPLTGRQGVKGVKAQERARKYLTRLADESGGRVYFPATKTDVENVANSILNDIRNQ